MIAQGVEAGGHVRGTAPARSCSSVSRAALPDGYPLLLPVGSPSGPMSCRALEAGAEGAVAGTRFLLSDESRAHPAYRRAPAGGRRDDPHRALRRRLAGAPPGRRQRRDRAPPRAQGPRGPWLNRAINRLSGGPASRYAPAAAAAAPGRTQRPDGRLLTPQGPIDDGPATLVDAGPLYPGDTVARIDDVLAARRSSLPSRPRRGEASCIFSAKAGGIRPRAYAAGRRRSAPARICRSRPRGRRAGSGR